MATPIEMPKPGVTVEECLLLKWHKREGDPVAAGDIVAEIETDKAAFEISAPADGVLLARFFEEGETVAVYTNLCVIGAPGEDVEQFRPSRESAAPEDSTAAPAPAPAAAAVPASEEVSVSPRARRFAAEHGTPLQGIAGSGPGGRILEADLKRAHTAPAAGVRDRIARRMRESLASTAQYTLNSSADAAGLLALRARIKSRGSGEAPDININEMVMFAAVQALHRMPEINAEFIDGRLHRRAEIHLGFACDTPRGLLAPVVKDAGRMTLPELSRRVKALTELAVAGKIAPDDLAGATFTVSNLGALGIESFTPILNPPQVALLGVNTIEPRPVRKDGRIEFVDRIGLSLTVDHQVIDGAPGARFLAVVRESIERIEALAGLSF